MNNMKNRIYRTFCLTKECKNILLIFIVINLLYSLSNYIIRLVFAPNGGNPAPFGKAMLVGSIVSLFLTPFISAGIFGITFLKINSKKIGVRQFFFLAKSNYRMFFFIGLLLTIIIAIISLCVTMIYTRFPMSANYGITPHGYFMSIASWFIDIFFIYSLPLVIVGFFSNQKLKPIRSSFSRVIHGIFNKRDFSKIWFIIVVLFLEHAIKFLSRAVIPNSYTKIYMPIVSAVIIFVVLIYSFLLITECF